MKSVWTRLLNLLVPGAGMIVLRREWLGLAVALLFCLLAQIAVVGLLLLPAVVPVWVATWAGVCAAIVWGWSQWLLNRRIRWQTGESLDRELELLHKRSAAAAESGDLDAAIDLIRAALTLNDENPRLNESWARLATRAGDHTDAVKAWRRVLQLTRDADMRDEARSALAALRRQGRASAAP